MRTLWHTRVAGTGVWPWGHCMAGYSDYYSVIARASSGKTDEARGAVYERARTALQKRLSAFDPPISETDLAIERFALEAAIQRAERESRSSDAPHGLNFIPAVMQIVGSVRDKLNNNIAIRGDSLKAAITAGLAQGLEFIQRTQLTSPGRVFTTFSAIDGGSPNTRKPELPSASYWPPWSGYPAGCSFIGSLTSHQQQSRQLCQEPTALP
jgi:hypothetical protein